jgi:hypothetical protein
MNNKTEQFAANNSSSGDHLSAETPNLPSHTTAKLTDAPRRPLKNTWIQRLQ